MSRQQAICKGTNVHGIRYLLKPLACFSNELSSDIIIESIMSDKCLKELYNKNCILENLLMKWTHAK